MHFSNGLTDTEYEEQIREEIRISSSTLFELVGYLSARLRSEKDETGSIGEFITLISTLGEGFQNSIEDVEIFFKERKRASQSSYRTKTKSKV